MFEWFYTMPALTPPGEGAETVYPTLNWAQQQLQVWKSVYASGRGSMHPYVSCPCPPVPLPLTSLLIFLTANCNIPFDLRKPLPLHRSLHSDIPRGDQRHPFRPTNLPLPTSLPAGLRLASLQTFLTATCSSRPLNLPQPPSLLPPGLLADLPHSNLQHPFRPTNRPLTPSLPLSKRMPASFLADLPHGDLQHPLCQCHQ